VQIVLAGNLSLEERLTSPKLESFHQRIAARCYLQPLGRDETIYYVQEQIRRCGASADGIFTSDAQVAIHIATDGIPRLINQVCDHALMLAALGRKRQIEAAGIEEAWADLQQLPIPLNETPMATKGGLAESGVIEFGQLSDVVSEEAEDRGRRTESGRRELESDLTVSAMASLDSISRSIDTLNIETLGYEAPAGDGLEEFNPAMVNGTEVELFFHGAHDPFGGQWEQEEVVLDRYASLQDTALRRQRVTSHEGQALGAAITAALESNRKSGQPTPQVEDMAWQPLLDEVPISISIDANFLPASDPLLPEPAMAMPTPRPLGTIAEDDRDIIMIDDEQPRRTPASPVRPKKMEYRQLFSKLREGVK